MGRPARWFGWTLAGVAVIALAVRVTYVLVERRDFDPGGDAFFYHVGANLLADGKGFIQPHLYPLVHRQAAEHPPLYLIFLWVPSVLGMKSVLTHVLWTCLLGTATVVFVGLVGREVGGPRLGIIAALDRRAVSEHLGAGRDARSRIARNVLRDARSVPRVPLLAPAQLAPSRMARRRCGAGALTRSELILLVPMLVLPLALGTRDRPMGERLRWLGAATLAALFVIAPWSIYNATRFDHPIILSAQAGPLLSAANCDSTYYGGFQGYFDIRCTMEVDRREGITEKDDESVEDKVNRREAIEYIRGHLSRLPTVERVRLQRLVGLYHPSLYVHQDALLEGRELWVSWAALWSFYGLALLSIVGAVVLVRRRDGRVPLYPLLAPIGAVIVTVLLTYASTRFRAIAEPSLAVLTAVAIDAILRAVFRTRRGSDRYSELRSPSPDLVG